MHNGYYCGKRLSFEGHICTVRYVGAVQGTKGEWLGVEWDDPARGKHNGQHGDIKYFQCRSSHATPASFVRPSRPHDRARGFVDALRAKYASESVEDTQTQEKIPQDVITISGKDVEEVGFDKIRRQLANFQALRIVVLDGACIGRQTSPSDATLGGYDHESGPPTDPYGVADGIALTCPNIVDLDLSRNLFESWQEILSIIKQLPSLSSLSISGNRLSDTEISEKGTLMQSPFQTLRILGLENCLLTWKEIATIASLFQNLSSLALGNNELRQLDENSLPPRLTHVSLEQNMFKYISQLRPLTRLETLRRLTLKGNQICAINDPAVPHSDKWEPIVFWKSLHDVDLSFNEISSWQFIDELASIFPGLKALRTSANPLFGRIEDYEKEKEKQNAGTGYALTIARLAGLETLNFSAVMPKDRREAEAFYLSQIGKELSSQSVDQAPEILSRHPRYAELCAKLGEPPIVRKQTTVTDPNSLSARLVHITFEVNARAADSARLLSTSKTPQTDAWEVGLPKSFTVNNVLGIVGKHFGLEPMLLKLVWETEEEDVLREDVAGSGSPYTFDEVSKMRLQEEVLVPRTRRIGTWLESSAAKVRIELSEEDFNRRQAAAKLLFAGSS